MKIFLKQLQRRLLPAFLLLLFAVSVADCRAATYTPQSVPNVHVQDRMRFVSNPDGILSAQAVADIDARLRTLRDSTSAEVMVVAIDDIADSDHDTFATELFSEWGLGKKDRHNGLLLLIVKDRRKAVIRTGYGLEGVLPDVACGRLLRNVMFPAFREDDYDGGTVKAVEIISDVISDPATADEVMSKLEDTDYGGSSSNDADDLSVDEVLSFMFSAGGVMALILLIALIVIMRSTRGRTAPERWGKLHKLRMIGLFASFLGLGVPLLGYIPTVLVMKRMRSRHAPCPNCGAKMMKLDEETDNSYLTHAQDAEERLNSIDYDVWLCPQCGTTDVLPYVNRASSYTECPGCGARACTLARDQVIVNPTTRSQGEGERTYTCLNCHQTNKKRYKIAKLASSAPVIVGGIGGLGGHGGGGGSFGGGFGGGMTGGGGASGGW